MHETLVEKNVDADKSHHREAVLTDAAGLVIHRSTQGPSEADELWLEATEGLIASD